MKVTEEEIFDEWVNLNGYDKTDPVEDAEYRKSMMNTLAFQRYVLGFRLRECYRIILMSFKFKA